MQPNAVSSGLSKGFSRREVLTYALCSPALAGLGVLTVNAPNSSAANSKLIDFTERLVPADQVAAAGYAGALVYVSELRPGATFDFKPVTREYADALRALGRHAVSCYQFGKPGWPTPSDYANEMSHVQGFGAETGVVGAGIQ